MTLAGLAHLARAGALEIAVAEPPAGLDPWAPPGTLEARLATLVYDRVGALEVAPVGERWAIVARGRWHDGRPVSADDVCFSLESALDADAPDWWRGPVAASVAGCAVVDARTAHVVAVAGDPRPGLAIPLVPRHAYPDRDTWFDPDIARSPLGSGRYRASGSAAGWTFRAAGGNPSGVRVLRVTPHPDPVGALLAGEVDGVLEIPPARVAEVIAADGISVRWTPHREITAIALDVRSGPTADPAVRRALDLLLDRSALRSRVIGVDATSERQVATLVSGPFFPESPRYARSVPPASHDPRGAADLLVSAGYTWDNARWIRGEEPLRLRVAAPGPPFGDPKLLYAVGGQWIAAGIGVEAVLLSPSAYARALAGEPPEGVDALLLSWVPIDPDDPSGLVGSGGWSNPFGYTDPGVDAGLADLRDPARAVDAAWQLHGRLADRAPFLFLWTLDAWSAWSDDAVMFTPFTPGDWFGAIDQWR